MGALEDYGEFVSADTPDHVGFAEGFFEYPCGFDQERGADVVAEGVIDLLEIVEIDEQDRDGQLRALREAEGLLREQRESFEVVEPSEFVAKRKLANLHLHAVDAPDKE